MPPAVQVLSEDYQKAYELLPSGPWAQRWYAEHFADFDLERFKQADDTTPSSGIQQETHFDAGEAFNLNRVLKDRDAQPWVEAKVADLAPSFKDEFANSDTPEGRLQVLQSLVSTGNVHKETVIAELFVRWEAIVVGMTEAEVDHQVAIYRQMTDGMRIRWELSEKDRIIRDIEVRVCQLLMWDIVHVGHTLDVVSGYQCDIAKAVELANGVLLEGKKPPTEDDYRQRVEAAEKLRASQ